MKKEDLKHGEVYFTIYSGTFYLVKFDKIRSSDNHVLHLGYAYGYANKSNYSDKSTLTNVIINPSSWSGWNFFSQENELRLATNEERRYLEICLAAKKALPRHKDEVNNEYSIY